MSSTEESIKEVINVLHELQEDLTVPRNIKNKIQRTFHQNQ